MERERLELERLKEENRRAEKEAAAEKEYRRQLSRVQGMSTLGKFSGEAAGDKRHQLRLFCENFETLMRTNQIKESDWGLVFKFHLDGAAQRSIANDIRARGDFDNPPYDRLKKSLMGTYCPAKLESQYKSEFRLMTWKFNGQHNNGQNAESFEEFTSRVRECASNAFVDYPSHLVEKEILQRCMECLPRNMQADASEKDFDAMEKLTDFVNRRLALFKHGQKYDLIDVNRIFAKGKPNTDSGKDKKSSAEKTVEKGDESQAKSGGGDGKKGDRRGKWRGNGQGQNRDGRGRSDPSQSTCWNCGDKGHRSTECPKPKQTPWPFKPVFPTPAVAAATNSGKAVRVDETVSEDEGEPKTSVDTAIRYDDFWHPDTNQDGRNCRVQSKPSQEASKPRPQGVDPVPMAWISIDGSPPIEVVIDSGASPGALVPTALYDKIYPTTPKEKLRKRLIKDEAAPIIQANGDPLPTFGRHWARVTHGGVVANVMVYWCPTMKAEDGCLLGVHAMNKLGFRLYAPTGKQLLGPPKELSVPKPTANQLKMLDVFMDKSTFHDPEARQREFDRLSSDVPRMHTAKTVRTGDNCKPYCRRVGTEAVRTVKAEDGSDVKVYPVYVCAPSGKESVFIAAKRWKQVPVEIYGLPASDDGPRKEFAISMLAEQDKDDPTRVVMPDMWLKSGKSGKTKVAVLNAEQGAQRIPDGYQIGEAMEVVRKKATDEVLQQAVAAKLLTTGQVKLSAEDEAELKRELPAVLNAVKRAKVDSELVFQGLYGSSDPWLKPEAASSKVTDTTRHGRRRKMAKAAAVREQTKNCGLSDDQRRKEVRRQMQVYSGASKEDREKILSLAAKYHHTFAVTELEFGYCPLIEAEIDTGDHKPIQAPMHRMPYHLREAVEKEIRKMLELGIIQKSTSNWAFPLIPVKKKDGSVRICSDFRKLNEITKSPANPLPRTDDMLENVCKKGAKIFSKLDLKMAFFQMPIRKEDRCKTAFRTHNGLYEYVRLPMGCCASAQLFQALMNHVLNDLLDNGVYCYLDDVLVATATMEEHLELVEKVFERFDKAGLMLRPEKCEFLFPEVLYLGHRMNAEGLKPDPGHITAIENYNEPQTLKEARRFYGMASYYRRFVPDFSKITRSISRLFQKDKKFEWGEEQKVAFNRLKQLLTEAPLLHHPIFEKPFYVETDGCQYGLGAVLCQKDGTGKMVPIAYASRGLNKHEGNYPVSEIEALGVIFALKKFRTLLLDHTPGVNVVTDHNALTFLMNNKNPSGRLHRWALLLAEMEPKFTYKPGAHNYAADALSRNFRQFDDSLPNLGDIDDLKSNVRRVTTRSAAKKPAKAETHAMPVMPIEDELKVKQRLDLEVAAIMDEMNGATLKKPSKFEQEGYRLVDGLLYMKSKLHGALRFVVPSQLRKQIIEQHHSIGAGGHFGPEKVAETIKRTYYWPKIDQSVYTYIAGCVTCARRQGQGLKFKPPLTLAELPEMPLDKVGMDVLTLPMVESGHGKVLVLQDYLTKFVWCFPLKNEKAQTLAQILCEDFFPYFGIPKVILSDRGSAFTGKIFEEVAKNYGLKQVYTTPYHPKGDGLVERFNRTLQQALAKSLHKTGGDWKEHLGHVVFAYNSMVHSSTGLPPFLLMFGREPRLPSEEVLERRQSAVAWAIAPWCDRLPHVIRAIWQDAKAESDKSRKRQKEQYDKHRDQEGKVAIGDHVWLLRPEVLSGEYRKLALPYYGPFKVQDVSSSGFATLTDATGTTPGEMTINCDRLTRCEPAILEGNLQELQAEQKDSKGRVSYCTQKGASALALLLDIDHRKETPTMCLDQQVEFSWYSTLADAYGEAEEPELSLNESGRSFIRLHKPMDIRDMVYLKSEVLREDEPEEDVKSTGKGDDSGGSVPSEAPAVHTDCVGEGEPSCTNGKPSSAARQPTLPLRGRRRGAQRPTKPKATSSRTTATEDEMKTQGLKKALAVLVQYL